jgi:hypothetical protein
MEIVSPSNWMSSSYSGSDAEVRASTVCLALWVIFADKGPTLCHASILNGRQRVISPASAALGPCLRAPVQFSFTSFLFHCKNGYDCSALIEETETARLRWQSVAIVLIASLALISWIGLHARSHSLSVRAYFDDARGLHAGATVDIAGVAVGSVSSVRVRPELRDNPAEVVLLLKTPYELNIPEDSMVLVERAGILGDAIAVIDISQAKGQPIHSGATLRTVSSHEMTSQQAIDCLNRIANHQSCDLSNPKQDIRIPPTKSAHSLHKELMAAPGSPFRLIAKCWFTFLPSVSFTLC